VQRAKKLYGSVPKPIRQTIIAIIGFTLLVIGVALVVLPGPGLVIMALGFVVLALEFAWAKSWVHKVRAQIPTRDDIEKYSTTRKIIYFTLSVIGAILSYWLTWYLLFH
jgi:hypothetical protein